MTSLEIRNGLYEMGIRKGDIVLLHSSLASIGHVEGGAEAVVGAFLDLLGEEGTLLAPVFEPGLGAIAEAVGRHPRAVKSVHPLACVAAIGRDAEELCRDHWKAETAHAQGTPYYRIAEKGGYVCLLGVDQDRNTTLHTVEALLRLPYLSTETRTFETPEGVQTRSWPCFPGPHRDFIGLDPLLRESGKMRVAQIGQAVVRVIKSKDLIDLAVAAGSRNPAFVLCDNPNCPDCIAQRAATQKSVFEVEKFTVVASASLAGDFPDEIAARCKESGITSVELDAIQGRPLVMLPRKTIVEAVERLRQTGLEVVTIRCSAVSARNLELVSLAAQMKVKRFVMPLADSAENFASTARDAGVCISFFNTDFDSDACSAVLLRLRDKGLPAHFTFNGANFARAGELPFLSSYKKKLRRFVDQLDLTDGTYAGTPQRLAMGNAEVKEMISVLRCASFDGVMSLTASNKGVTTLQETADRLLSLLRRM